MTGPLKLFLIAGEPSGDRLGAALMAGLKQLTPVDFAGVGGPLMQAEGMASLFPMEEPVSYTHLTLPTSDLV